MNIGKNADTFNLGDTSFRHTELLEKYKAILIFLDKFLANYPEWNPETQEEFYKQLITQTDLFDRKEEQGLAKRGRTLTNSLVKIGLTNSKRKLSDVALNWIQNNTKEIDNIERILGIDSNNIVFVRQLLKLRVYNNKNTHYFYPFRIALELTSRYQNIPQYDFLTLIHLIQPEFSDEKIEHIINDYQLVHNGNLIFNEFIDMHFSIKSILSKANKLFNSYPLDKKVFFTLFTNRKSMKVTELYYEFVDALLTFKMNKTKENLEKLLKISSNEKNKKAFGFRKNIFKKATNVFEFLDKNADNVLLSNDNSLIYKQFKLSKRYDITKEYCDMTKRTFNLSGLLDFSNGLVNSTNHDIFSIIFKNMPFSDSNKYPLNSYEDELDQPFYQELTVTEILNLNESAILSKLQTLLKVNSISKIKEKVLNQKETKFRNFIKNTFPKEKILQILPLFSNREDKKIQDLVSKYATVPTIYEYIVAIAWFYISKEKFNITKSLNLTLDGNMLPLSHAVGGAGDIVIDYKDTTLMLEVTLMNANAQKRGEWEPVLRHTVNLTIDRAPKNVVTLFIADELDHNTINIWKNMNGIPLKSSNKNEYTEQVKIFPLINIELIEILENQLDEDLLIEAIDNSYKQLSDNFDLAWRDEILDSIRDI